MKQKYTCRQTFEVPWWRKQATILNTPLALRLAATILNAALAKSKYENEYGINCFKSKR